MKTDLFRFLYQRSEIKRNRKVFVFVVCLVISFISWLQVNLSKEYVDNIPVQVDFVNLPQTRFGMTKISSALLMEVEADGFTLLKYEVKDVEIDFKKLKKDNSHGAFNFLPNHYIKSIAKQMGDNFKVIRSVTDTIQLVPKP